MRALLCRLLLIDPRTYVQIELTEPIRIFISAAIRGVRVVMIFMTLMIAGSKSFFWILFVRGLLRTGDFFVRVGMVNRLLCSY